MLDSTRKNILTGRERHTHARPDNVGYPARAIRTHDFLYILNMKSERWPVGDPVDDTPANRKLGNSKGYIPGYHDIDGSPTKTFILENKDKNEMKEYFNFSYAKRDAEQLYNISGYFGEADPCFGDIDPLAENGSKNR